MLNQYLLLLFIPNYINSITLNHNFNFYKAQPKSGQFINAYIQLLKNSQMKYQYNIQYRVLEFDKIVSPAPQAYGFIPGTMSGDKQPLDIIIISSKNLALNTLVKVKIIGVLITYDNGKNDNKILSIFSKDPQIQNIDDVGQDRLKAIIQYYRPQQIIYGQQQAKKYIQDTIINND